MDAPVKESKAQRAERIKRERSPWEMLPDLLRYAREGFGSIPEDDLNLRFRWWGLYTQGDGRGAVGGGGSGCVVGGRRGTRGLAWGRGWCYTSQCVAQRVWQMYED